eukprot:gene2032-5105_t
MDTLLLRIAIVPSTADRLAEITRKKEQLAEIKRRRQERSRSRPKPGILLGTDLVDGDVNSLVEQLLAESKKIEDSHSEQQQASSVTPRAVTTRMRFRSRAALGISEVRHEDVLPAETIVYAKGCQTDLAPNFEDDSSRKQDDTVSESDNKEEVPSTVMADDEAQHIMNTYGFQQFFDRASLLVERVLHVKYDPLIDYAASDTKDDDDGVGDSVRLKQQFFSKKWSTGRTVTAIDWNPKHQELLAASYNDNSEAPTLPDGCVLLWNLYNPDRPERIFECQSAVVSCKFAPYQPQVLVGGTYSGQIVAWDLREKKATPHQQSNLNANYHSHPVFCLDVVGTQNAHSLVSVSTDGRLCCWNLDSVLDTQDDVIDLSSASTAKSVAPTCMSFPTNDINNLIVGSEDGSIYHVSRVAAKQDKMNEPYVVPGYSGPITGVQFHPSKSTAEFSDLFLSSSTDWTVKLWSLEKKQPLIVLDYFDDYVYDVEWSPVHPALFATADGLGNLDFWDLNHDTEVPYTSVPVRDGKTAINKIRWNSAGTAIATGDADGYVSVYELRERLSTPSSEATIQFRDVLGDMKSARSDESRPVS